MKKTKTVKQIFTAVILLIFYLMLASCAGPYENEIDHIAESYNRGEYGDELYYLKASCPWSLPYSYAILRTGQSYSFIIPQQNSRCKSRELTDAETDRFLSFINDESIDTLPHWDKHTLDGIHYQYLHCTKEKKTSINMHNPESDSLYGSLVSLFKDLADSGVYETVYRKENVKILIDGENAAVESVWKNGEDFRVCINRDGVLMWHRFRHGIIGETVPEPDGFTVQDAWTDVPEEYINYEDFKRYNRYPWQVQWNSYLVRVLAGYRGRGLYLTKKNEEMVFISQGNYFNPIVIPDSDWVVCTKSDHVHWWKNQRLVKINLRTYEEYDLNIKPAYLYPIAYINNKLLVYTDDGAFEYDMDTDRAKRVHLDFFLRGARFFQPAGRPGKYFITCELHNGTSVAVIDLETYRKMQIVFYKDLDFHYDAMWVDIENGKIYVAVNNDLLELDL